MNPDRAQTDNTIKGRTIGSPTNLREAFARAETSKSLRLASWLIETVAPEISDFDPSKLHIANQARDSAGRLVKALANRDLEQARSETDNIRAYIEDLELVPEVEEKKINFDPTALTKNKDRIVGIISDLMTNRNISIKLVRDETIQYKQSSNYPDQLVLSITRQFDIQRAESMYSISFAEFFECPAFEEEVYPDTAFPLSENSPNVENRYTAHMFKALLDLERIFIEFIPYNDSDIEAAGGRIDIDECYKQILESGKHPDNALVLPTMDREHRSGARQFSFNVNLPRNKHQLIGVLINNFFEAATFSPRVPVESPVPPKS